MTIIRTNLISPNQALQRNIRREHNRNQVVLVNLINTYLEDLNRWKGNRDFAQACFDTCNSRWKSYVAAWNIDPSRLSELRATDFEDFIEDYFKNKTLNMKRTAGGKLVVLCCDPSLTAFGYAVVTGNKVLDSGCIKTEPSDKKMRIRKSDDRMRRISEINQTLKKVIEEFDVAYIVSELPHGSQNAQAAMALGMVSGVVQTIADFLNIGIEWYSEGDSKKATLFKISSTKQDMIDAIDKIFEVRWSGKKYIDEAVADSLSIYNCSMKTSPFIKTLNNTIQHV